MLKILIVDTDIATLNSLNSGIGDTFECVAVHPSKDIEAKANAFKPDILLIDLHAPAVRQAKTIQPLTNLACGKRVVVIFTSEKNDIDTKIEAYNLGAHDFISKPLSDTELAHKLDNLSTFIEERESLINSAKDTQSLAMTSMKQASHYGYIMNFFKNLYHSNHIDDVAKLFFNAMDYWGLKACVTFRLDDQVFYSCDGGDSIQPIERKIFIALENAGRLYSFGNRLLVNDLHASFLIKNMPKDETEAGEIRDIVAAVIEGLEAKIVDLKRQAGLNLVTERLSNTIHNVKQGVNSHSQLVSSVITDMIGSVASSFHDLDLTEAQEEFFHDMFEKSGERMMAVEDILLGIQEQLSLLSNQVTAIIDDTTQTPKLSVPTESAEIELF